MSRGFGPGFSEEHPESVELWSPGSPAFTTPDGVVAPEDLVSNKEALACVFLRLPERGSQGRADLDGRSRRPDRQEWPQAGNSCRPCGPRPAVIFS